jgi:Tol biopolymer transport system component
LTFPAGTSFGRYQIAALLGVGGMGEVYRATDTGLKRDVAIKTLPQALMADADRTARLQREAELLATLNHPNIAHVYGLEHGAGALAIVMELVDGPTLAERIAAGPVPPAEALSIARQVLDALEAAHARGIVHRDLKPENVKVNADGVVKVLDFGIAKALESPHTLVATDRRVTHTGMVVGSPGYMSPEQAAGRAVDERVDIWAFGCLLYELLTGNPAFATDDRSYATLDLAALPRQVPAAARDVIELCLRRDPKRRFADVRDVRLALDGELTTRSNADTPTLASARRSPAVWLVTGLALGAAAVGLLFLTRTPSTEQRLVTRFSTPIEIALPEVSIADDGARIAYWGGNPQQIYVRDLAALEPRPVLGTEDSTTPPPPPPCFSPDGNWLAFSADGYSRIKKVPIGGGTALPLADGLDTADFCDWGEDGFVYFGTRGGIERVGALGGSAELVVSPAGERGEVSYELPLLLPRGEKMLVTVPVSGGLRVAVVDLATRTAQTVLENAGFATYAATGGNEMHGHLLYGRNGVLMATPFDLETLAVGAPTPVADGIAETGPFTYAAVSRAGTLAYVAGDSRGAGDSTLVLVDRAGAAQPIADAPGFYGEVRLSPDGRRAALAIVDPQTFNSDLWVYELADGRFARLTFDEPGASGVRANIGATWTPDGARILYFNQDRTTMLSSGRAELRSVPSDGSALPVTLVPSQQWRTRRVLETESISPDGRTLLGTARDTEAASADIWMLPLASAMEPPVSAAPRDFLATSFDERDPAFSPDGRYVAYSSNESGHYEIYVVAFPGPGGKSQVSRAGGRLPRWNPNGGELYYFDEGEIMAVDVDTVGPFRAGNPRSLFATRALATTLGRYYDVARDGPRFLLLEARGVLQPMQLRVAVNWFEELRQLAPPPLSR